MSILAALKVVRYVVDAKADLKQYGLADPLWKIEIDAPNAKHTIWLGDFEGKTKRVYATLPGTGSVFVLDEIDALILARPRSAYEEMEKKK